MSFKKDLRPGTSATLFETKPSQEDVVLNVEALWADPQFAPAIAWNQENSGDPHASASTNFGAKQSEVVLRSTLRVNEINSFCGQVPSLEQICATAGISDADQEEAIWQKMVELEYSPAADSG